MKNIAGLKIELDKVYEKIKNGDTTEQTSVEKDLLTVIVDMLKVEIRYYAMRAEGNIPKIDYLEHSDSAN